MSCDQPSHSHWKGQRYNYTHQRKSGDCKSVGWSSHQQQWKLTEQKPEAQIPKSESLNNHYFPSVQGQWKLHVISLTSGVRKRLLLLRQFLLKLKLLYSQKFGFKWKYEK